MWAVQVRFAAEQSVTMKTPEQLSVRLKSPFSDVFSEMFTNWFLLSAMPLIQPIVAGLVILRQNIQLSCSNAFLIAAIPQDCQTGLASALLAMGVISFSSQAPCRKSRATPCCHGNV